MRWAQTVRLNLSNDRQKVDSSDLNWGNSDRAKIVYTEKTTGKEETIEIDKMNNSVKAAMSIINQGGIIDNRNDEHKEPDYVGNYLSYLFKAFYTDDDLTINDNSYKEVDAKITYFPSLKSEAMAGRSDQTHFATNKQFFFGRDRGNDDNSDSDTIPAGIVIFNKQGDVSNLYANTSLEYNKIKILNYGSEISQKLELSLDIEENGVPVPTIELESVDVKRKSCLIQPDEIKFNLQEIDGNIEEDLCINNNSIVLTSFSETNEDSICELKSNLLSFKDFKYTNTSSKDTPDNYESWLETNEANNYNTDRKTGTSEFYGFNISNEGIHINQNPKIEHKQEGWSSNKPDHNALPDSKVYVPNNFRLYPVGWGNNHLSTGILDDSGVINAHENSIPLLKSENGIPFIAQGNFNYYDFNLSKYCNEYFGHRNIYDTGPEYRMHVRIELIQDIKYEASTPYDKKYIAFCMNINLGRWYNYTIDNKKGALDGSGNLEVYDKDMVDNGDSKIGGITKNDSNSSKFIPSSLLNYGWTDWDSSGTENVAPIINFSKNKKGLLQIPGPHITPNKINNQDGSYFSEEDGNVTTSLSTGPDHVVTHNLHGNYVYYQRWACKVQTVDNLAGERLTDPTQSLTGDSFKEGNGDKYECDYWIRIIWPDYEVASYSGNDINGLEIRKPEGINPGNETKNIQIRLTQIA